MTLWSRERFCLFAPVIQKHCRDGKVHGVNGGPSWGRQARGGPHIGPTLKQKCRCVHKISITGCTGSVKMTTFVTTSDVNFIKITTFWFQCMNLDIYDLAFTTFYCVIVLQIYSIATFAPTADLFSACKWPAKCETNLSGEVVSC